MGSRDPGINDPMPTQTPPKGLEWIHCKTDTGYEYKWNWELCHIPWTPELEIKKLKLRVEELEKWKESATAVLAEWDEVHKAAGSPGLGQSKAVASLAWIRQLELKNKELREAFILELDPEETQ